MKARKKAPMSKNSIQGGLLPVSSKSWTKTWSGPAINASQCLCSCQLTPWKQNSLVDDSDCSATVWWDIPHTHPTHIIYLANSKCTNSKKHILKGDLLVHSLTSFWNTLCKAAEVNFLTALICLLKKLPCSSCAVTMLSLVLGALSASTGFPSLDSFSTVFWQLRNPAARGWGWKAMLGYTRPYNLPVPEIIFWIW